MVRLWRTEGLILGWETDVKVTMLHPGSGGWPTVNAALIEHQVVQGTTGPGILDTERERISQLTASQWRLAFQNNGGFPPDPTGQTRNMIALLIWDAVGAFNGLWFRSTVFDGLPTGAPNDPNGIIEIVTSASIPLALTRSVPFGHRTPANAPVMEELFAAKLPLLLANDDRVTTASDAHRPPVTTIDRVTLEPETRLVPDPNGPIVIGTARFRQELGGPVITAVFHGSTRKGPGGAAVDFALEIPTQIAPTQYVFDLTRVLDATVAPGHTPTLKATPANSSWDSHFKSWLINTFSGVILDEFLPNAMVELSNVLSAAVREQAALQTGQASLPAGVTLTARDFNVDGNAVSAQMTLSGWGGVFSKFPQSTVTGSCMLSLLSFCAPAIWLLSRWRKRRRR